MFSIQNTKLTIKIHQQPAAAAIKDKQLSIKLTCKQSHCSNNTAQHGQGDSLKTKTLFCLLWLIVENACDIIKAPSNYS